jgi:hypothetical protein
LGSAKYSCSFQVQSSVTGGAVRQSSDFPALAGALAACFPPSTGSISSEVTFCSPEAIIQGRLLSVYADECRRQAVASGLTRYVPVKFL